jgi:hypothetical protein
MVSVMCVWKDARERKLAPHDGAGIEVIPPCTLAQFVKSDMAFGVTRKDQGFADVRQRLEFYDMGRVHFRLRHTTAVSPYAKNARPIQSVVSSTQETGMPRDKRHAGFAGCELPYTRSQIRPRDDERRARCGPVASHAGLVRVTQLRGAHRLGSACRAYGRLLAAAPASRISPAVRTSAGHQLQGIASYKLAILLFNLIPYGALRIALSTAGH